MDVDAERLEDRVVIRAVLYPNQGAILGTITQRYVFPHPEDWQWWEPPNSRNFFPSILLEDCELENSANYGINTFDVWEDNSQIGPDIELIRTDFANIVNTGVRYEFDCDLNLQDHTLQVTDCLIDDCGNGQNMGSGIAHEGSRCNFHVWITDDLEMGETECSLSGNAFNGLMVLFHDSPNGFPDVVISDVEILNNGTGMLGSGVVIQDVVNGGSLAMSNCDVNWNISSGIFCFMVDMNISIDHCTASNNGRNIAEENAYMQGMGIKVHMRDHYLGDDAPSTSITFCEITDNGFQGASISDRSTNGFTTISHNVFHENAQNVFFDAMDANDPMEGAQIHLFMGLVNVDVSNNIISSDGIVPYPATGICIDEEMNDDFFWQHPGNLKITNNIQYHARYGLYLEDYVDEPPLDPNDPPQTTMIYNNVFWNNDIDGAHIVNATLIGNAVQDGELVANQMQSNLFGQDDPPLHPNLAGIRHLPNSNPNYQFNGFFQNPAGHALGCGNPNSVVNLDPQLTSNYRLYWNSPMINRGIPSDDLDPRGFAPNDEFGLDGSRNDIGAFGGPGAAAFVNNEFGGPDAANWADMDPFCVIGDVHNQLNDALFADQRPFLEWDYYCAFDNYETPLGAEINIGDDDGFLNPDADDLTFNVYIDNKDDVLYTVDGELHTFGAPGDLPLRNVVTFSGYEDEIWWGIEVYGTPDETFLWTVFEEAYTGLSLLCNETWQVPWVDIEECTIRDCIFYGLENFCTPMRMHGVAENLLIQPNTITNIQNPNPGPRTGVGAWIWCNVWDGALLENTTIRDCGLPLPNQVVWSNGLTVSFGSAELHNVTIERSGVTGISCFDAAPVMNGSNAQGNEWDNDIRNNGDRFEVQDGVNGAEVYLAQDSYPLMTIMDISEEADPHGVSVYKANNCPLGIDATESWWGADPPQAAWFVWGNGQQPIDFQNWLANPIDIDDDDDFERAFALMKEDNFDQAAVLLERVIREAPNSANAVNSARLLMDCYLRTDRDMNTLRRYYGSLIENYHDSRLERVVQRLIPRSFIAQGHQDQAMISLADLEENGRDQDERDIACLERQLLERVQNRNQDNNRQDQVINFEKTAMLMSRLALSSSIEPDKSIPTEFALEPAFPNPFNSTTTIRYQLPENTSISLFIYDMNGRKVTELVSGAVEAGYHQVILKADEFPSGIYLCRLEAGSVIRNMKLALIK